MSDKVITKKKGFVYLAISIVFVIIASIFNYQARLSTSGERRYKHFQSDFLLKEKKMDDILLKLAQLPQVSTSLELLDFCEKNKINNGDFIFLIYQDSLLTAWSSNEIIPPKHWKSISDYVFYIDNIWTYAKQITSGNKQYVAHLILDDDPDIERRDNIKINNPFANDTAYNVFNGEPYLCNTIYNNAGEPVFTLSVIQTLKKNNIEVVIEMILWLIAYTLLLFAFVSFLLQIKYFREKTNMLFLVVAGILVSTSLIIINLFHFSSDLFSPLYYSSHYDSLGMLFFNSYLILLGSSFFMQFFSLKDLQEISQKKKFFVLTLVIFAAFLLHIFNYIVITGITNDSVVVLKPEMVYQYDLFSIIAIASIVFILWSAFNTTYKILDEAFLLLEKKKLFILIVVIELLFSLLVFIVSYYVLIYQEREYSNFLFLFFILLILVIAIYITMQKKWHNMLYHCLIYLILSVMVLFATGQTADEREKRYKESMAEMVLSIEDPFILYSFNELAEELESDTVLMEMFNRKDLLQNDIQQYLITNYIKKYAGDYRINIDIGLQSSWKDSTKMRYKKQSQSPLSKMEACDNVSFQRVGFGRSEYVIDLSIPVKGGKDVGKIVISFIRAYVDSEQQSELEETLKKEMSNYSYAGYENNVLKMNAGNRDIPYFYNLDDYQLDTIYSGMTFVSENITHTVYKYNNMVLLVSTGKKIIWDKISFVIILFLGQFIFSLLPMSLNDAFKPNNIWQPGLQESIQYFIIILIALTVITTAFIFVRFYNILRMNDLKEIHNQSSIRINRMVNSAIAERDSIFDLSPDIIDNIDEELSSFYELDFLDLNLYNKSGENIQSYGRAIYVNTPVNPSVFRELSSNKTGTFIADEIYEKEKFRSYYRTIINKEGDIIGYTNLFSNPNRQQEMIDFRHTQFLTMFMMVCVFIIILIVLFSMFLVRKFTLPLLKVAERLSNIKLGEEIKKIEWHREDEFGQLVKNYNLLIDRLDESAGMLEKSSQEIAWRDMARQVAHEIKNPLTPMRLTTQQMMRQLSMNDSVDKEKLSRYFAMVIQQTDTLTDIANSFSNFAKVDQQDGYPEDLLPIIQNTISSFDEDDVSFTLKNYTKHEEVISFVNKSQISRVFNNLIKNAIQAKKPTEKLSIIIELENYGDKMWQITLMDTGLGMTEEVKAKVFSPNFTTKNSGTGLGLAMTKRIINTWGGNISFDSTYNVGTIFYITLPKYEEHVGGKEGRSEEDEKE
jgi:signal transduction histidine kinase